MPSAADQHRSRHVQMRVAAFLIAAVLVGGACGPSNVSNAPAEPTKAPAGPASQPAGPASQPPSPAPALTTTPAASSVAATSAATSSRPSSTVSASPTPSGGSASAEPTACASPANPEASPTPGASGSPPAIALQTVASGFSSPLDILVPPDGTGRLFVVEQGGTIRIVKDRRPLGTPFLDITSSVTSGGERGLRGLAFHPGYACNGRFFVNYTDTNGDTVVAEYAVSKSNPDRAGPNPVATLLHIDQPFPNHNGGDLVFGPDGFLYVGMGDGGSAGDPQGNGQRLNTLLAKLLRIDLDHPGAGTAYGIPPGNCAGCGSGVLPEVDAYGLRNPWRFTFDRATTDLWIGDVGQGQYEEIDHVTLRDASGANFGWNRMEGRHCYSGGNRCDQAGLTLPAAEYDHSSGDCSVTGGLVYRGSQVAGLAGWYLFSDYCSGVIRAVSATASGQEPAEPATLLKTGRSIVSFGEAPDGELYVADLGSGEVLRVVAAP